MKKIILSLIAGTMLSSTAFAMDTIDASKLALPAEGQVCSDIHDRNPGGINVKELSPYAQCVMIENDMNTGFTYKTFWTKSGTTFVPHDVEELAKMNSSERGEAIKDKVIEEVVIEKLVTITEEIIIEDTAKIEALEKEIAANETAIKALQKANSSLLGFNEALVNEINSLSFIVQNQKILLNQAKKDIKDLTDKVAASYTADDLAAAKQLAFTTNRVSDEFNKDVRERTTNTFKRQSGVSSLTFTSDVATLTSAIKTYTIKRDGVQKLQASVWGFDTKSVDELIEEVSQFAYTEGFKDGFNEGYVEGYQDGYNDGYESGYADGFSDGVASVK